MIRRLQEAGVDVAGSVNRFSGNEALYLRFVERFREDETYSQLCRAYQKGDHEQLLTAAHTLKGVAANLGMNALSDVCAGLVRKLRAGETDVLEEVYGEVARQYKVIVDAISG